MGNVVLNQYLGWIAGFPLLGAILNGFLLSWFGKLLPRSVRESLTSRTTVHLVAVVSVLGSLVSALAAAWILYRGQGGGQAPPSELLSRLWIWFPLSDLAAGVPGFHDVFVQGRELAIPVHFSVDRLSAMMAVTVSGISFLIHVYSMGYMGRDGSHRRFFTYLNLFVFFMLVLVLADNLVLMFVGWEGVGLCSYLLIGFWFDKDANAAAGKKAFIVNRIGDLGFLLAILFLASHLGTVSFRAVELQGGGMVDGIRDIVMRDGSAAFGGTILGVSAPFLICMLLLIGAAGKSAQIPLYVWLPDAMAGPTPVSALIHAATMVTAGIYMIVRLGPLFVLSPTAMAIVATVGAVTALFAATIGLAQNDIKKVLAYSTISQLGYMFLAVGVGAFTAGMFHLFTHAFFKACLFLCAGAVIHALHERQDIREMGGLRKRIPVTHWTFLIATLAIVGCPPFAGFFSKDEILWTAYSGTAILGSAVVPSWWPKLLWLIGLATAGLTALYMFRLYFLVFWGDCRAPADAGGHLEPPERTVPGDFLWKEPHTPVSMRLALMTLGVGSAVVGLIGMPHLFHVPNYFARWLRPSVVPFAGSGGAQAEWLLMGASVVVAALGAWIAWSVYRVWPPASARALVARVPRLYRLVADKWRIDELYGWVVVRPARALAFAAYEFVDRVLIDTFLVTGAAYVARGLGGAFRRLQGGVIHRHAALMAIGLAGVFFFVARPFTTVPLVERSPVFALYDGTDPEDGAALIRLAMPGAPYAYEIDYDADGVPERFVDLRRPDLEGAIRGGDTVAACLLPGDYPVRVTARSGFGFTRAIDLDVRVDRVPSCRLLALSSGERGE
jgi:NADH-quinone oxidoreductase subunit L